MSENISAVNESLKPNLTAPLDPILTTVLVSANKATLDRIDLLTSRVTSLYIGLLILGAVAILISLFFVYFIYIETHETSSSVINYIKFYTHVLTPTTASIKTCETTIRNEDTNSADCNDSDTNVTTGPVFGNNRQSNGQPKAKRKLISRFASNSSGDFRAPGYLPKYLATNMKDKQTNTSAASNLNLNVPTTSTAQSSNEKLRIKMKRSESWDAKNQVYLNSATFTANLADKKVFTCANAASCGAMLSGQCDENGISLPINMQERYYCSQMRRSDGSGPMRSAAISLNANANQRFSNAAIVCINEDDE